MRLPLLLLGITTALFARAQLSESFTDSNYTAAPVWNCQPGAWIVNAEKQLQSSHTTLNSSFWISTPNTLARGAGWRLWMRLDFATSSANYIDIWIISSQADPELAGNTGYFIRVGGAQDEVSLYRKDAAGTVKIIDGADGTVAGSANEVRLHIVRTDAGVFHLMHAIGNSGSFRSEGAAADQTYNSTAAFALAVRQSTGSFVSRHYFDDLQIAPHAPDVDAPAVVRVRASSDSTLRIHFSEAVDGATAGLPAAYLVSNGIGNPSSVYIDPGEPSVVHLRFATRFNSAQALLLSVFRIRDYWGNELVQDTDSFEWYAAQRHDIVFTEIMADPSPPQGLTETEYVELRNTSRHPISLQGFRVATLLTASAPMPDTMLQPGTHVVITASSNAQNFSAPATVIALANFPALDNEGSELKLLDATGRVVHSVAYEKSWYRSAVKDDGGWSLECIDPTRPCGGGNNWMASRDAAGGTPGAVNSVDGPNNDTGAPRLLRTTTIDSLHLLAVFDEPLDSTSVPAAAWQLEGGPAIASILPLGPLFETVEIRLAGPLLRERVYRLSVDGVKDCAGNTIGDHHQAKAGLPQEAITGDLVWNELLFQPRAGGAEYVELYNRSEAVLDLARLYITTRTAAGALAALKRLSLKQRLCFPGDYYTFSADTSAVASHYFVMQPEWLLPLPGMPSLADDGATIVLFNGQGDVVEELTYDPDWHFKLIADAHGVALERLQAAAPARNAANWHSAASTAGYGTPTARNSQSSPDAGSGAITIAPAVFSPDNDGFDDIAFIDYSLPESGYMANLSLFDAGGRIIRQLVRSALLARSGRWAWDGLDENGRSLPSGIYVLWAELFNLQGQRKVYKRTVVLARKR